MIILNLWLYFNLIVLYLDSVPGYCNYIHKIFYHNCVIIIL